jgi:L-malate glycosyltransferase
MKPDITVILATYNRAKDLDKTLKSMVKTEKKNLKIQFIIVDNNSKDNTKEIVEKYETQIPIVYIFESRSGKNVALNSALDKSYLGSIVVFTDDDVDVSPDWLIEIYASCQRWPNHKVFGGKINVVFPTEKIPHWISNKFLSSLACARHDYSNNEIAYGGDYVPFGPNYWVRKEVFSNGRRFDETMGPHPKNRISGDEIAFLLKIKREGNEIIYSPSVVVAHRIQTRVLKLSVVYLRAYQWGRGRFHIYGLNKRKLQNNKYIPLRIAIIIAIIYNVFKIALLIIPTHNDLRIERCAKKFEEIGCMIECFKNNIISLI